jgi:hypothetical protein
MLTTVLLALVAGCALPVQVRAAQWSPDHVVIVIEENRSYRHLVPELAGLTRLQRENANFTAGRSFAGYSENLPQQGFTGVSNDHYELLHTIEDFYGLSPLTDADARAPVISDAFGGR